MAMASAERRAGRSRRIPHGSWSLLLVVAILLGAGCSDESSSAPPVTKAVTGGVVQLEIVPSFRALLGEDDLHLTWVPPPCSWRLKPPHCGGAPVTDAESMTAPIVGGTLSHWPVEPTLRGRLELAGRVDVVGPLGSLTLDDLTIDPGTSTLLAGTPTGWTEALFLDGSTAQFDVEETAVRVSGVEVKLLGDLSAQMQAQLGVPPVTELVKVGDVQYTAAVAPAP